jgi:hypothetical protein
MFLSQYYRHRINRPRFVETAEDDDAGLWLYTIIIYRFLYPIVSENFFGKKPIRRRRMLL